jgi:hypothetical protein
MKRFRTLAWQQPAPAAGQGLVFVPSPVQRVKLQSVMYTLTTAVAVANRLPWLRILDPTGIPVFGAGSPTAIAATAVSELIFSDVYGQPTASQGPTNAAVALGLPDRWLPPGWQVQIGAVNLQAADQISVVSWSGEFAEAIWDQEEDQALALAYLASLAP